MQRVWSQELQPDYPHKRGFFYPIGEPKRLGDLLDSACIIGAEVGLSPMEVLEWPTSMRTRYMHFLNEKIKREIDIKSSALEIILTGIAKIISKRML
jgi:hypothetical protein